MEEIRFEVGGKYENMKGVYEVIAIHKDSMDIRWENGEEVTTPIDLQQRIIERMQHEKEIEEAKALQKAKKARASSSKAGKQFSGLSDSDFGTAVSKTSWRGRGQLGGAVAQRFKAKQFKFNSWAVLRKPEVNWLDVKRQKPENWPLPAKFLARAEDQRLCFGVHIPAPPADEKTDWHLLLAWLAKPENDVWLKKQCRAHAICLRDLGEQGFSGVVQNNDDQWIHTGADEEVASLSDFLSAAGESGPLDLRIEKQVDKAEVVARKQDIAGDMAAFFDAMMPLFAAITAEGNR